MPGGMTDLTPRTNKLQRPLSYIVVTIVVAAALGVLLSIVFTPSVRTSSSEAVVDDGSALDSLPQEVTGWPVDVAFEVTKRPFPDLNSTLETSRYRFTGNSWDDWQLETLTGRDAGHCEAQLNGEALAGDEGCSGSLDVREKTDPALGFHYPTAFIRDRAMQDLAGDAPVVPVDPELAEQLAVPRASMIRAQEVRMVPCDEAGLECRDLDRPVSVKTETIVHEPTSLMLQYKEVVEGELFYEFKVLSIEHAK